MIDARVQVLRLVRQHGSVTAAADAMHLTPSGASQQLRGLARDLGVPLLEREGRGVRLTVEATVLLEHADVLAAQWEQARADLAAFADGEKGPVRLCGFPSALAALLPAAAARLRELAPGLRLEVVQADPGACLDRLVSGASDLAVLEASPATPGADDERFSLWPLFDDPLQLVVPADHRLAGRGSVSLRDAGDDPWIAGPPDGSFQGIVRLALQQAGVAPAFVHRALDWSAYLAIVRAGLGVALLPRLAAAPTEGVARLTLTDRPVPSRQVLACARRGSERQPAIRRLAGALEVAAGRPADAEPRPSLLDRD